MLQKRAGAGLDASSRRCRVLRSQRGGEEGTIPLWRPPRGALPQKHVVHVLGKVEDVLGVVAVLFVWL